MYDTAFLNAISLSSKTHGILAHVIIKLPPTLAGSYQATRGRAPVVDSIN